MPRGVSTKGYKMTENRKSILVALAEDGGEIRSKEGRATGILQELAEHEGSPVSFNASLRQLEELGFIKREVRAKKTYAISITVKGRKELDLEPEDKPVKAVAAAGANGAMVKEATISDDEWEMPSTADGIDYEALLGVFLKAALRGMEGPSNSEVDYYKQKAELADTTIHNLEQQVEQLRAEAASAIAERDQLQKNLNVIMSKSEAKATRGTDPIRKLLSPSERTELDNLVKIMQQRPTSKGD